MTLKAYLILMGLGSVIAWGAVGLIILATDPAGAPPAVFAGLYASLLLALTGTLSVAGFGARTALFRDGAPASRHVIASLRQAILLSTLAVASLALSRNGLLTWWTGAIIIAMFSSIEYVFVSGRRR